MSARNNFSIPHCLRIIIAVTTIASGYIININYSATASDYLSNLVARHSVSQTSSIDRWSHRFTLPGIRDSISALAVQGNSLYAGGNIAYLGEVSPSIRVNNIIQWNGNEWSTLGFDTNAGVNGSVRAIVADRIDLYVGGLFTQAGGKPANRIAKWNGSNWSLLGSGVNGAVYAMAINGDDLYVGGSFTQAGGKPANRIAKWNIKCALPPNKSDQCWSSLGSRDIGVNNSVRTICVSTEGVIIGGDFTKTGDNKVTLNYIARWDGKDWSDLGKGVIKGGTINTIAVSGNNIYVGGKFTEPGTHIAKYDGNSWVTLGSGVNGEVRTVVLSGGDVYLGGDFTKTGDNIVELNGIAKLSGNSLSPLGNGVSGGNHSVQAIAIKENSLYAGGAFTNAGNLVSARNISKWDIDSNEWIGLGAGFSGYVNTICVDGKDIYVGGRFIYAGGLKVNRIAKWDGNKWTAMGEGLGNDSNDEVHAIAVSGNKVFVGGMFSTLGDGKTVVNNIAVWDTKNKSWSYLGQGIVGEVRAIAVDKNKIYVGGSFEKIGSMKVNNITYWDGAWKSLPWSYKDIHNEVHSGVGTGRPVEAIAISGSHVYLGGVFTYLPANDSNHEVLECKGIAEWDGKKLQPLGFISVNSDEIKYTYSGVRSGSVSIDAIGSVEAIAANEKKDIYFGGSFTEVGKFQKTEANYKATNSSKSRSALDDKSDNELITVNHIAVWNSNNRTWSGLNGGVSWNVSHIAIAGNEIYLGGHLLGAGRVAIWSGKVWSDISTGTDRMINTIALMRSPLGIPNSIEIGGNFQQAGNFPSNYYARYSLYKVRARAQQGK